MDISLLKTFLEVTKTRNFARAAENLYVTSAAVSARIKQLESQLGVVLFTRPPGKIQLTSEGERLVPLAETMVNTWARTLAEVSLQPAMDTRVYLGATASLWAYGMQDRLLLLRSQKPGVAIQAEAHSHETLLRLLEDQSLDLVLLPDPQFGAEFAADKIGEVKLVLCSRDHTDMNSMLTSQYIFVDWGTAFGGFHARKLGEKVTPTLHVNLASIALSVIEKEGGAAYVPRSVVVGNPDLHEVVDAPVFTRPIFACYRQQNPQLELIRELAGLLKGLRL